MVKLNYIISEIGSIFEIVLTIEFIIACLGWKDGIKHRKIAKLILFVVLFALAQENGRFHNSQIVIVTIDLLILMLYAVCILKENIKYKLIICVIPFFIVSVINVMIVEVLSVIQSIPIGEMVMDMNYLFMIGVLVSKVLFFLLLKRVKDILQKSIRYLQSAQLTVVIVLIIYTVVMEFCVLYIISKDNIVGIPIILSTVVSGGIIMLSAYMIYSIFTTAKQNEELMKMNVLKIENQENYRQLRELKNSEQRIRKLEHDFKNHCLNIGELIKKRQYCEAEEYLRKIVDNYLLSERVYIETQNPIIDAVLNTKIFQAKQENIDISCYAIGNLSELDGMDYGSILFNLLDNAIEATCQNKLVEKKVICNINRQENSTEIFIRNSIEESVLKKNKNLVTCKSDKELHGMGKQIVQNLVDKMNGILDIYEEEKMFCVHIYILE